MSIPASTHSCVLEVRKKYEVIPSVAGTMCFILGIVYCFCGEYEKGEEREFYPSAKSISVRYVLCFLFLTIIGKQNLNLVLSKILVLDYCVN